MSFEKNTIKNIDELIERELRNANSKYPLFSSEHEGYAVILEEYEETKYNIELADRTLENIWENIKTNSHDVVVKGIVTLRTEMQMLIAEAIQTAAMCDKMIMSMKKIEKE